MTERNQELHDLQHRLKDGGDYDGPAMITFNLTPTQLAVVMNAVAHWTDEMRRNEYDPGDGVQEDCGLEKMQDIERQLVERAKELVEA